MAVSILGVDLSGWILDVDLCGWILGVDLCGWILGGRSVWLDTGWWICVAVSVDI